VRCVGAIFCSIFQTPTTVDGVKKTESQISEEEKDQKLVVHCDEYLQPFTNRMLGLGEYNGGMAKVEAHDCLPDPLCAVQSPLDLERLPGRLSAW
jgi:hypothetical protein